MEFFIFILSTISTIIVTILQGWRLLPYFQQEEYNVFRFLSWTIRKYLAINLYFFIEMFVFGVAVFIGIETARLYWLRLIVNVLLGLIIYQQVITPKKIKLVYTLRLQRLIITFILLSIVVKMLFDFAPRQIFHIQRILFTDAIFILCIPLIIVFANSIMYPFELLIKKYYLVKAKKKIDAISPFVIGITGSYGKTSSKEILHHVLQGYKPCYATPKSYNTLMGVTKAINTSLNSNHDCFIVEMGAYKPKEIKVICDLVRPTIGIITAIGSQHLERFKTIENVAKAKYELIDSLPQTGTAIFDANDSYSDIFLHWTTNRSIILISVGDNSKARLIAFDIIATNSGIQFWVKDKKTQEKVLFSTMLLGEHNILNILFATAAAVSMGMKLNSIADRIKTLRPVPHRLQLIKLENGINIIDDAYNSNPIGAENALKSLGLFSERRILVTPGLIELGEIQEQENYDLGILASKTCDLVILVGEKQTKPIYNGLLDQKVELENIKVVDSTKEATLYVSSISKTGDTILYLNDLPDLYSENV